ncbi:adenylate/guanylate cyclase domain-containing protein [Nocardioides terrisoli]|uniref:adenylate/guanylate cyclase domain-containing protein n=1 Tax=Nocardioides terrisoli TaxID=3388267 RepID=UPI00287BB686|nr:adenylate/guanylate cyclase domain-containing protein [Nocardioides marmorisolisilvae]
MPDLDGPDPHELLELLERILLGSLPSLTSAEVAERTGISQERARERWRALGFTEVPEGVPAFTEADVHALQLTERLRELGFVGEEAEASLIRTVGRGLSRLAELQVALLARTMMLEEMDLDALEDRLVEVSPVLEEVMAYVLRRHSLSAASRMLLSSSSGDDGQQMAVGFADIVGYTRQTRSLRQSELAELVEEFESRSQAVVTAHQGRVIKTIGDEILFVTDTPEDAARIGLELTELEVQEEKFPELRVGLAYGSVLSRLGDVYGPVVNLAARLTSTARPGKVLADRGMADALKGDESFRLRRMRRTAVRGYRRLEPWSLRRPLGEAPQFDSENLPGPASQFLAERGADLVRAVDERKPRGERSSSRKGGQ